MANDLTGASKFMSLVPRHDPATADVTLDPQGWVTIDALVAGSKGRLTRAIVLAVVAENAKRRFALSDDETRVRARQGHSVTVDLGLSPTEPPAILFHGTVERFVTSIMRDGLVSGSRQHVHLSPDRSTAQTVARRRGKPVILRVDAAAMHGAGHAFFRSENGVWLTDAAPSTYLTRE